MPDITISAECFELIRASAVNEFKPQGHRLSTGEWMVPISDETYDRIMEHRLAGETTSDSIIRIISVSKTGAN